ncbi:MAG: ATP-dependent DNA helicase RecG [Gammaproteobacteria bacterium]|nr:ATP-dependent DNA helicase RecG [Gammaproteobacteria bacterium]
MQTTAQDLFSQLLEFGESARLEAKRGSQISDSVMQTVCAFANEPGLEGGYLLLGVSEPDAQHDNYHVSGVTDVDQLLNELHNNCRSQFEQPVFIQAQAVMLEGRQAICVFVPELENPQKPCVFKGRFDSKNKRKTGVWRRGSNGDYECGFAELTPLLKLQQGQTFERTVFDDALWDDLDPDVIALYRRLRAQVRPKAEELQGSDEEMLLAMRLLERTDKGLQPNVACLLLFGKTLSLRRLLPAVRVDYVRTSGTQWVEDPHNRFDTTLDMREPLLRLIPRAEAAILDDLPRHFRLKDGDLQRSDQPLLPYKVVREAVVNMVMHRDYAIHQPSIIVRYRNRIETLNAGYSLKAVEQLGETGSILRNPILANVLYDLEFAEVKGTGIRTMRRMLKEAGLEAPVFVNYVIQDQFKAIYLLHQLMGEEQLAWLAHFSRCKLSEDEAKALILAREIGAVDNAAIRAISDLDTLETSQVLRRLHHNLGLLNKGGAGSATYYQLNQEKIAELVAERGELAANAGDLGIDRTHLNSDRTHLDSDRTHLDTEYAALLAEIALLSERPRKEKVIPLLLKLCAIEAQHIEKLAQILNRDPKRLKSSYLNPMRKEGLLNYLYPEVVNHPQQAYVTTEQGKAWLKTHKE